MLTIIMVLMAGGAKAAAAPVIIVTPPPPVPPPIPIVIAPPQPRPILFLNVPPPATELPQSIRDLATAAFDAGDEATLSGIFKLARHTNPQAEGQIQALEAEFAARRAEKLAQAARERADRLAAASLLQNWKGEAELGGSRSTGNTKTFAIYGSVSFDREGLRWQHSIKGRADFQRSNGVTTADRYRLSWQPNYKMNDKVFVYGLSQYERDRFLGFSSRFTLSAGVGFKLISTPDVKLDVQGGPAVRYTDSIDDGRGASAAGRASMSLRWKLTPTLNLAQDAAVYLETGDSNAQTTTSIDAKLIGNLKARFSYDIQFEDRDIPGTKSLDTTSRATLVYSF